MLNYCESKTPYPAVYAIDGVNVPFQHGVGGGLEQHEHPRLAQRIQAYIHVVNNKDEEMQPFMNEMWCKTSILKDVGFETCFGWGRWDPRPNGPGTQGAERQTHLESRCCASLIFSLRPTGRVRAVRVNDLTWKSKGY